MREDPSGQFKESDDVGRSLSADRRQKAKKTAKKGEGDRGEGVPGAYYRRGVGFQNIPLNEPLNRTE